MFGQCGTTQCGAGIIISSQRSGTETFVICSGPCGGQWAMPRGKNRVHNITWSV